MQIQQNWISSLLLVILVCAGVVHAADEDNSMSMKEVVDMIEPFGKSCKPEPEKSHIEEMVLNKEDASHESKCFRRCMLQLFEIMNTDEMQFDEAKTMEMMNMMFSDKEDTSKNIVSKCNQAPPGVTDECEVAHAISMCMLREMRDANYKIPEVKE